jgi:cytochrome c5
MTERLGEFNRPLPSVPLIQINVASRRRNCFPSWTPPSILAGAEQRWPDKFKERRMRLFLCGVLAATALVAASGAQAADGQAVYSQSCALCHDNIPPKLGDKVAWAPLIKQGTDALVASVIKGKGAMPPRAGKANLSDDDIKASVEYLESKSQ